MQRMSKLFLIKIIKLRFFLRRQAYRLDLPLIKKVFFKKKDNNTFTVFIKNSPVWQKTLLSLQLTSFYKNFIIESEPYLTENGNFVAYEFLRYNASYAYHHKTSKEFFYTIKRGCFVIDKRTIINFGHLIVTGKTGSGKSYALFGLISQLYKQRAVIGIIDPKSSELAIIGRKIAPKYTAFDNEAILSLTKKFVELLQKRKEFYSRNARLGDDYKSLRLKPAFLIIDEFASLRLALNKKENDEFLSLVSRLILEGRQNGVFVIIALQKADSTIIPTAIREQVSFAVVLGDSGTQTYRVLLGDDFSRKNYPPQLGSGKGIANLNGVLKMVEFPCFDFELEELFNKG